MTSIHDSGTVNINIYYLRDRAHKVIYTTREAWLIGAYTSPQEMQETRRGYLQGHLLGKLTQRGFLVLHSLLQCQHDIVIITNIFIKVEGGIIFIFISYIFFIFNT